MYRTKAEIHPRTINNTEHTQKQPTYKKKNNLQAQKKRRAVPLRNMTQEETESKVPSWETTERSAVTVSPPQADT